MVKLHRMVSFVVCLGFLSLFLGCAGTQQRESTGQYIDDSVITAKVKTALAEDPAVKGRQIDVNTYRGVVQLSGFVDNEAALKRAGEVASTVQGVQKVLNNIAVKPPKP